MTTDTSLETATEVIVERARERFRAHRQRTLDATDRLFARILVGEWLFGILVALVFSPYAWQGRVRSIHEHVWLAVLLGGAIVSLPVALATFKPGLRVTRHLVALGQILWSALLIHLTGGRIETHFHIFGSLAILAFYLDWQVLMTATVAVVADHLVRGVLWPESIYGIANPEWWRFLEHGFWVLFCLVFLVTSCRRQLRDWMGFAEEGGMLEAMAESEWRHQSVLERARVEAVSPPAGD